jgi:hypothetical protein
MLLHPMLAVYLAHGAFTWSALAEQAAARKDAAKRANQPLRQQQAGSPWRTKLRKALLQKQAAQGESHAAAASAPMVSIASAAKPAAAAGIAAAVAATATAGAAQPSASSASAAVAAAGAAAAVLPAAVTSADFLHAVNPRESGG